jgi:pheromone shutdown-related protein TraB
MTKYIFVGTSHVSSDSIAAVKNAIEKEKPDAIAVELDPLRYNIMTRPKNKMSAFAIIRKNGLANFMLMGMLSGLQSSLGSRTGVSAGGEMLKAVELGCKHGIKVALIDMDIREINHMVGKISFWERMKIILLLSTGISNTTKGRWNVSKVPSERMVSSALAMLRKNFPDLYDALITERENFMARFLISMKGKYKKVLVVVGAGHVAGIKKRLYAKKRPKS